MRYESELHNHCPVVHTDASGAAEGRDARAPETRSNFILHYGSRPDDNYEITYIMHNQQPWAKASDRPCLVTYNPIQPIDPAKVVTRTWFQHVVHDVYHTTVLLNLFPTFQGKAAHLVLRRAYRGEQPGALVHLRHGGGALASWARSTPLQGESGRRRVVQLLRSPDARTPLPERLTAMRSMGRLLGLVLLAAAGCDFGQPVTPVGGPGGQYGWLQIRCPKGPRSCREGIAAKACPKGYEVAGPPLGQLGVYRGVRNGRRGGRARRRREQLVVACK